jgi:tRNA-specific 2-thiouridylase
MEKIKNKKVVLGMSGGVDSSIALLLLKKMGYDPIGVSLEFGVWESPKNNLKENVCCSRESLNIAKSICEKLKVPHFVIDATSSFQSNVIDYFQKEFRLGRTPSPCVFCNQKVKFKVLFDFADKIGAKFVATGHYARVNKLKTQNSKVKTTVQSSRVNEYQLLKAQDNTKDQTYSLSFLTQNELSRIIFPLGKLTKSQVYKIAKKEKGFEIFEKRKQSQDFCFVANASLYDYLEEEVGERPGEIVDEKGRALGRHAGIHFYTLGQRKGIGICGGPYYVVAKDKKSNKIVVSKSENKFYKKEIILEPFNLISDVGSRNPIKVKAKLRSTQKPATATLRFCKNSLKLTFDKPQRAVTPGQIAVFYLGDVCLGGGVIN